MMKPEWMVKVWASIGDNCAKCARVKSRILKNKDPEHLSSRPKCVAIIIAGATALHCVASSLEFEP